MSQSAMVQVTFPLPAGARGATVYVTQESPAPPPLRPVTAADVAQDLADLHALCARAGDLVNECAQLMREGEAWS